MLLTSRKFYLVVFLVLWGIAAQGNSSTGSVSAEAPIFNVVSSNTAEERLRLGRVFQFVSGAAELQVADQDALTQLIDYLKSRNYVRLRIEGYTDARPFSGGKAGVLSNNWTLSAARAGEVAKLLVDGGIDAEKLVAVGMGANQPVATNQTAAGRRANRRVELVLEKTNNQSSAEQLGQAVKTEPAAIIRKLKQARPDLQFKGIKATAVPELYEVELGQGNVLYATASGGHFVVGEIYQVGPDGIVNLTEQKRALARAELLKDIDQNDLITFAPEKPAKSEIYVFTDVDCGYCRLLHREVARLNELGVSVNYLAYPRGGLGSDVYRRMVSAWCADDRKGAMTALKTGKGIPSADCEESPVRAQFQLGHQLGVQGTPAIFLADGTLIPGYRKADELAAIIGVK